MAQNETEAIAAARAKRSPLERAWAMLRVARTTSSEVEFIEALNGAMSAADEGLWRSEVDLVREQVADLQRTRGPLLVPAQLGGAPARLPEDGSEEVCNASSVH
jgi:hypothetical protein